MTLRFTQSRREILRLWVLNHDRVNRLYALLLDYRARSMRRDMHIVGAR